MIKKLITRPIAVTMSVIAIMVMSLVAMGYLPVSLMPAINIPQITVQVAAPGMSVREIDNVLLKPLKNQLSQVAGLKNITAEARADIGTIYMDFEPDFIDVNEKMDRAITSLPKDVERPKVIKASVTDIPAFYLNLSLKNGIPGKEGELREAGIEFSELGQFARDVISKRIEQLPQTAMVDISGVVTPELLCIPNYAKLTSMGADISLLEQAINNNNTASILMPASFQKRILKIYISNTTDVSTSSKNYVRLCNVPPKEADWYVVKGIQPFRWRLLNRTTPKWRICNRVSLH